MKKPKSTALKIKVARLPHAAGLPLPAYQTPQSAGADLLAAVAEDTPVILAPGRHALIPTGLSLQLPLGTEAQIRPRSGLAAKFAVTVLNSPGTIDADYRGEVQIILINHGSEPFIVRRGDRIAQMVIAHVVQVRLTETTAPLSKTARGTGGFGSTGIAKGREKKRIPQPTAPTKKTKRPALKNRNS